MVNVDRVDGWGRYEPTDNSPNVGGDAKPASPEPDVVLGAQKLEGAEYPWVPTEKLNPGGFGSWGDSGADDGPYRPKGNASSEDSQPPLNDDPDSGVYKPSEHGY